MENQLSIVITQHKETEKDLELLFDVLNKQINVDFNEFDVVLVNDISSTPISNEFLDRFTNLHITHLTTKVDEGVGMARQFAIDNTKSKWIWFIDGDDTVFSILSVSKVLERIMIDDDIDVIQGKFYQEVKVPEIDKFSYVVSDKPTWIHSKIYKKEFLEKNNIRFAKGIRINEDTYFNSLVFNLSPKIAPLNDILTIWRANPNSVTRKDNGIAGFYGYIDFIKAKMLMINALKSKIPEKTLTEMVIQEICYFYFDAQKDDWLKYDDKAYKQNIDDLILLFFLNNQEYLGKVTKKQFNELYQHIRLTYFTLPSYREKETIEQYYERLQENFEKNQKKLHKTT